MIQNSGRACLVLEAFQHVAATRTVDIEPHRLQRQRAANVRIGRPIHHSHCALAKLSGYYVAPNLFGSHRVLIVFVFIQTKSVKLPAITEKHCKHSRVLLAFDPTGDQSTLINSVTNGECPMRRRLIAFVLCASFALRAASQSGRFRETGDPPSVAGAGGRLECARSRRLHEGILALA